MQAQSITVAGGGSWGTALAHLFALCGHATTLWLRNKARAEEINTRHENSRYLKGFALHPTLSATLDPKALTAPIVVSAIPCQNLRQWLTVHAAYLRQSHVLLNVAKGIELESLALCSEIFAQTLPKDAPTFAVLSGPSFAADVLNHQPTAVVLACEDAALGKKLRDLFSLPWFRCYGSSDVTGVLMGGALKNVMAIAAGISDGLGLGANSRSALITRALAEMCRIGMACGAKQATFMGLSGLGDLVLTCTGDLSRNRQVGLGLGRGEELTACLTRLGTVAEGVPTTKAVYHLAATLGVDAPLTQAVYHILYQGGSPAAELKNLLARTRQNEDYGFGSA